MDLEYIAQLNVSCGSKRKNNFNLLKLALLAYVRHLERGDLESFFMKL